MGRTSRKAPTIASAAKTGMLGFKRVMSTPNARHPSCRCTLRRLRPVLLALALLGTGSILTGCHGALFGAGIGALTGQAIGGNTESTVAGAAYGAWVGAAAEHTRPHTYYRHHAYRQQRHRWCYDY